MSNSVHALLLYTKTMSIVTRKPLSLNEKRWLVKRMTLNMKYADIIEKFEEKFGRTLNPITLSRLKQKQLGTITKAQAQIVEQGAIQAASLQQQSYRLLQHKMNNAEEDVTQLDKLRKQWRNGEITDKEYKKRRQLYEDMTVGELTNIANAAHMHSKGKEDDPHSPADDAAFNLLIEGIRAGNPVQVVQVLNRGPGSPVASEPQNSA